MMYRVYYDDLQALIANEVDRTYRFTTRDEAIRFARITGVKASFRPALYQREEFYISQDYRKVRAW